MDIFCGWFMDEDSAGFDLSASALALLASRNVSIGLCVYKPLTQGADSPPRLRNGIPLLQGGATPITLEAINELRDETP